jgi:hypothetical protein
MQGKGKREEGRVKKRSVFWIMQGKGKREEGMEEKRSAFS